MPVKQKDIAEKLGCSLSLVSRVLSGQAKDIGISKGTEEKVLQMAKELGYVPNAAALTLKGKATHTIGVVVYDFKDPYFSSAIDYLQEQAHEHGYSLLLVGFRNRYPDRTDLLPLHKHQIDGVIALGSDAEFGWLKDFRNIPVARIGHGDSHEKTVRIITDEKQAADKLIKYITETGHKSLICIKQPIQVYEQRCEFFTEAAKKYGTKITSVSSKEKEPFEAGFEIAQKHINSDNLPDVFVCACDRIALGAASALIRNGIKKPIVTGFDDIPATRQSYPPITTIRQPLRKMAAEAFKAIIEKKKPQLITLPGKLIVRD